MHVILPTTGHFLNELLKFDWNFKKMEYHILCLGHFLINVKLCETVPIVAKFVTQTFASGWNFNTSFINIYCCTLKYLTGRRLQKIFTLRRRLKYKSKIDKPGANNRNSLIIVFL